MDSRSYNFSTAKKRSTLLEAKIIYFPKEGENTPRNTILKQECSQELSGFKQCLKIKLDEAKCGNEKDTLNECAAPAFRMVNTTPSYNY